MASRPHVQRTVADLMKWPPSTMGMAPIVGAHEGDVLPGMTAIGPVTGERKIRDWALVLQSMSVWHAIRRTHVGWILSPHWNATDESRVVDTRTPPGGSGVAGGGRAASR